MGAGLLSWTWRIARLSGVSIELHLFFLIYVAFEVIQAPGRVWFVLGLFLSVLLHELGHCWMARNFHLSASRIVLWPLGGLAQTSPGRNATEEFMIAVAGPAMHVPICLAIALYLHLNGALLSWQDFLPFPSGSAEVFGGAQLALYQIMQLQVFLFCFNLFLPAYPLDGGRVLVATLSRWVSRSTTAKISMAITTVVAVWVMICYGAIAIGFLLLYEAVVLLQAIQSGQIAYHPMFAFNPSRALGRRARKATLKSTPAQKAVVLQFRRREKQPDARNCPQCQRAMPDKAVMCGFCEP